MGFLSGLRDAASGAGGEPDLSAWAAEKGLTFHGTENVVGFGFALKEDGNDVRRNVLSGELPGGEHGVIFHNAAGRITHEARYGDRTKERKFTQVATFVPPAIAGLQRFAIPVQPAQPPGWSAIPDLGLTNRHFLCSPNLDVEYLRRAIQAGLVEHVNALPGDSGALEAGLPMPFYADPAAGPVGPMPAYPTTGDVDGIGLDQPISGGWQGLAGALGTSFPQSQLVPEDVLSFYRAYPRFPVPGQIVIIGRGLLPGTDVPGRTLVLADNYPDNVHRGFDAFMLRAAGAADTPGAHLASGGLRYAVRDGWACVWRPRPESRSPHLLDTALYSAFAAEAVQLARTLGWEG